MDNKELTPKEKADAFLKDIDEVSKKHGLLLSISNPQFVIQPSKKKEEVKEFDIEKMSVEELAKIREKYASVLEKAQNNVSIITAEIEKRK